MMIFKKHVIPMIITCMLQGTLCDTGILHTFYGGNIFANLPRAKVSFAINAIVRALGVYQTYTWQTPVCYEWIQVSMFDPQGRQQIKKEHD